MLSLLFLMVFIVMVILYIINILGHHGSECAAYASAHLLECLLDAHSNGSTDDNLLIDAFTRLDTRITARCHTEVCF
jgi:hypothetical protein